MSKTGKRTTGPERALAHPLWLMAALVSTLSTHPQWGALQPLHGLAGGCLLLMVPALCCALLRAHSAAAVLSVHVVLGQLFVACQLSPFLSAHADALLEMVPWLPWAATQPTHLLDLWGLLASALWVVPSRNVAPGLLELPGDAHVSGSHAR